MTAHLLALLCWIMPSVVPMPKVPARPTDAQILAEGQRRANQFCTPEYQYPKDAVPFIVPCAQPVPDCDSDVSEGDKYGARCTGRI